MAKRNELANRLISICNSLGRVIEEQDKLIIYLMEEVSKLTTAIDVMELMTNKEERKEVEIKRG